MPTRSLGFQSFYQAQLTAAISATDLTIPLDVLPTPSEGILVIESTVASKREIIYYTSKTASAVVCPAGAGNGRGYDGTTAVSHLQNSAVIMAPVAQMFKSLQDGTSMSSTVALQNVTVSGTLSVGGQTPTADWSQLASAPNTVTANGNRSYSLVFNSVDYTGTMQPGTRVRTTRTVTAPTQCTSLNGTSQYYTKTSPTGLTFTTTFTCMAWVKLNAYGSTSHIIGRRNGATEGFNLEINANGQVSMVALRILANNRYGTTYQSIPLNKWVHVAASMDVSVAGNSAHKMYIDGVEVPSFDTTNGTITALVQGTTALAVGAQNTPAAYFNGKIAQAAVFSAVLSAATISSYMSQGLAGTETSLISAYSFNNSINDLNTTNANNLTANGSAVATNADSPFTQDARGVPGGTYDYGIIQSISFSTNTTVVVQVPEGNTIPTSGGVSALFYSSNKAPFGFTTDPNRWRVLTLLRANFGMGTVAGTYYSGTTAGAGSFAIKVPIGYFNLGYSGSIYSDVGATSRSVHLVTLSTNATTADSTMEEFLSKLEVGTTSANSYLSSSHNKSKLMVVSSLTTYYVLAQMSGVTGNFSWGGNANIPLVMNADVANL